MRARCVPDDLNRPKHAESASRLGRTWRFDQCGLVQSGKTAQNGDRVSERKRNDRHPSSEPPIQVMIDSLPVSFVQIQAGRGYLEG